MTSYFSRLMHYDREVHAAKLRRQGQPTTTPAATASRKPAAAPAPALASRALLHALAHRGSLQTEIGLAQTGLRDLLQAHAHGSNGAVPSGGAVEKLLEEYRKAPTAFNESWLEARLGEALRVYARDVLLSRPATLKDVEPTVLLSLQCFTRALESAKAEDHAWVRAHRAAGLTMLYWVRLATGEQKPDRDVASFSKFAPALGTLKLPITHQIEQDFEFARPLYDPQNRWCERFYAFFLALRGGPGDYNNASHILEVCQGVDGYHDSMLDRHQAMLYSYDTLDPNPEVARRAALHSVEKGLSSVRADSEDYIASYFSTYSLYWLAYHAPATTTEQAEEQQSFKSALGGAIEAARTRSRNAMSQARATLVGLSLIEAMHTGDTKGIAECENALAELEEFADLETRAMFLRDPMWKMIQRLKEEQSSLLCRDIDKMLGDQYGKIRTPLFLNADASEAAQ